MIDKAMETDKASELNQKCLDILNSVTWADMEKINHQINMDMFIFGRSIIPSPNCNYENYMKLRDEMLFMPINKQPNER